MVQEYRRIMLDEDELRSAFEGYRRIRPLALPPGKISRCVGSQEGATAATITLTIDAPDDQPGPSRQHLLTEAAILEPLIRFCIENNIVLPRAGRKTVSIIGNSVSLCVALNLNLELSEQPVTSVEVNLHSLPKETILKSIGTR